MSDRAESSTQVEQLTETEHFAVKEEDNWLKIYEKRWDRDGKTFYVLRSKLQRDTYEDDKTNLGELFG